jgi:hypothetical protein
MRFLAAEVPSHSGGFMPFMFQELASAMVVIAALAGVPQGQTPPPSQTPPPTQPPPQGQAQQGQTQQTQDVKYKETVVVSASKTEQKLVNAPVSMTVIGPEILNVTPSTNYGIC